MRSKFFVILSLILFPVGVAFAATQGTLGLSSTGTVDLSIPLGNVVQVSGLVDFALPLYVPGSGDVEATQEVCVFANNTGGDYQVSTTSLNENAGQWRLHDGLGNYLTYNVAWVDAIGGQTFADNTAGAWTSSGISPNQDNGNVLDPLCAIGTNSATLAVQVPELGNLDTAVDGVYTDTLTIVITPN